MGGVLCLTKAVRCRTPKTNQTAQSELVSSSSTLSMSATEKPRLARTSLSCLQPQMFPTRCGDPCLPGLVSTYPTPSYHHSTSLFPSQTILINPLSNPCIRLSAILNPPVGLPRKLRPVLVLCPRHLGFTGESFSTLLS